MRVLIDATPLLMRSAGVKNFLYHWLAALRALGAGDVRAFPRVSALGPLNHDGSVLPPLASWLRLGLVFLSNVAGEWFTGLLAGRADVFHASNQVRCPPRGPALTATLYDLTYRLMPQMHTGANVRADSGYIENTFRRARRLIAISENSKADAVRLLGLDPDRIEVLYPGVAEPFFGVAAADRGAVAARYSLKNRYVLYVGTIEPRKNVDGLLDAWALLPASLRESHDLVVAGPPGWLMEKTLARLRATNGVRYLGYVSERDLPALTAEAEAFVFPSFYEGFGFPVAQAMACGVPVVTSNVSSLREVAGEGGLLVDPRSPAEIASALARLLESPHERRRLGEAGARRAASCFRWEAFARASLEFFRRAAG
jgi:glycosyltransferase involved in cell wall biosynthesis